MAPSRRWLAFAASVLLVVFSLGYSGYLIPVYNLPWGLHEIGLETPPLLDADSNSNASDSLPDVHPPPFVEISKEADIPPWDSSWVLNGPPTKLAKDNLKGDKFYITSWSNAGFTNQFMSYVNMIYVGIMADRIPIIPPFAPHEHIPRSAGALPFGHIFNMSIFRESIKTPVLEWSEVKALPSTSSVSRPSAEDLEQLGCWSTRHEAEPQPIIAETVIFNLHLDVSYTRVPPESRMKPGDERDVFTVVDRLVPFIFPDRPRLSPDRPLMAPSLQGHRLGPDQKLSCFDLLYYVTAGDQDYEWRFSWSPVWRFVGKHLHFTDSLINITKGYLSRVFQSGVDEIPPFIAVHMRRGDFAKQCWDTPGDCLIPLSVFQNKVEFVKQSIQEKHNKTVSEVILMSDETDPAFWSEVHSIGWVSFDHTKEQTIEKYGDWYAPIIDVVAHSMASGFVGTEDSTFSLVSSRRVEDWRDGVSFMVSRRDREMGN